MSSRQIGHPDPYPFDPRGDTVSHLDRRPPLPLREHYSIGVVVPTVGRARLSKAVTSVMQQTRPPDAVLIVVDGEVEAVKSAALLSHPLIEVISSRPATGVSGVRNAGISHLQTDLVALLDDDDEWLPYKLELQAVAFASLRRAGVSHPIVASRILVQDWDGQIRTRAPLDLLQPNQRVSDYLFRRRRVRRRGAMLLPSTLLFDRQLGVELRFDESIFGGEDADWLLRAEARGDTRILQLPEPLACYTEHRASKSRSRYTDQFASGSRAARWQASAAWLMASDTGLTAAEQADALLCDVAPKALMAHDLGGYFGTIRRARQLHAAGSAAWIYITVGVFMYAALDWLERSLKSGASLLGLTPGSTLNRQGSRRPRYRSRRQL